VFVVVPVAVARAAGLGIFAQLAAPLVPLILVIIVFALVVAFVQTPGPSEPRWTATQDANMGAWLRREREERGRSLTDIAAKTRINARFLRAIEDENFDLLPGGMLFLSFLRQYAEQVGLVPATVVALFDDYYNGRIATGAPPVVQAIAPSSIAATAAVGVVKAEPGAPASHRAARTVFGVVEVLLPKRLASEELGDALEYIAAHPRGWRVWVKIVSTIFWTGVNAVREWRSAFGRKAD
jgi:hypothetical protein